MERVAGQLARNTDVYLHRTRELKEKKDGRPSLWETGLPLPSLYPSNVLEPGRVRSLLPVRPGENEFVRGIKSVELSDQGNFFLLIDVDSEKEMVRGSFPASWEGLLRDELIERVRNREQLLRREKVDINDRELRQVFSGTDVWNEGKERTDSWEVAIANSDFVIGGAANRNALQDRLRRAHSCIVIASSALASDRVKSIAPHLKAALNRGVRVDILWGGATGGPKAVQTEASRLLRDLEREIQESGGRLMVSSQPTGSNARVLLSDPDGELEALVGSFDWLSSDAGTGALDLSVRITHPGPVSRLCLFLADLFVFDERLITSANSTGLKNASAELEKQWSFSKPSIGETDAKSELRLVFDLSHLTEYHKAIADSREMVTIGCRSWNDPTGAIPLYESLLQALSHGCKQVDVLYGFDQAIPDGPRMELTKHGARFRPHAKHYANYLICDENYCLVSSYAWLGRSAPDHRPSEFEVGVCLEGGAIGRRMREAINSFQASVGPVAGPSQ